MALTLYSADAPNPHAVEMFIRVANLPVNIVSFDLDAGEQRSEAFLAKNSSGQVPLLELDNGLCITEVPAICEYLAEVFPNAKQTLIADTAEQRAIQRMWFRKIDLAICEPLENSFRFGEWADYFSDKMFVSKAAAPGLREQAEHGLKNLNALLAVKPYICGQNIAMVDVFLYAILRYFKSAGFELSAQNDQVLNWYSRVEKELGETVIA